MVSRLLFGSVLTFSLLAGLPPAPIGRTAPRVAAGRIPHAVRRTFSRRRSPTAGDEALGEFVHAIERGRIARPLEIVRA
jgi:hypothetical protein